MANVECPYGQRGSILLVKQDFLYCSDGNETGTVQPSKSTYVIFRDGTRVEKTGPETGRVIPSDGAVRHWGDIRFRLGNFLPRWPPPHLDADGDWPPVKESQSEESDND